MNWWEGIILGLIQGLTEFLPVSSSGHLVIGERLLGVSDEFGGTTFEVFVHFGTVMSISLVYFDILKRMVVEGVVGLVRPMRWKESWNQLEGFRLCGMILITMIPTGLVYLLAKDFIEMQFQSALFASGMLIVTSVLLLLTLMMGKVQSSLRPWKAFVIGVAQSFAMLPGISRSGSTIATALCLGVSREEATRFSFLMSVPVICGATLLDVIDLVQSRVTIDWIPLVLGMMTAFVSGIFAIRFVRIIVQKGRLYWFAMYCLIVGLIGLAYFSRDAANQKNGENVKSANEQQMERFTYEERIYLL
nr:undecaprenyl-diphosphate phosphatase [Cytophagales bacterium]